MYNMKKNHQYIVAVLCFCTPVLLSCLSSQNDNDEKCDLGDYESITFHIDPRNVTSSLETDQYTIDSVCSLMTPDSIGEFNATKYYVNNEKIYVLDTEVAQTILVFDIFGKYLYKLGGKGRAKNEYIGVPYDFFVAKNGDVHMYDPIGQNMLVFDNNGKYVRNFRIPWLHSFGLTSNGKYVYCYNYCIDSPDQKPDPSLLVYDAKLDVKKPLIPSKHFAYYFQPSFRTFFNNDVRLSHVPILSDSVVVFKNDSIEKVVRFDFKCGLLSKDKPEWVRFAANYESPKGVNYADYHGVEAIYDYQETESLVLMNYGYKSKLISWLYDKRTKKIVQNKNIFPIYCSDYCLFSDYILKGNQIIAYVGKENVDVVNEYCESKEFDKSKCNMTSQLLKDFRSGKISVPALVYITIK